MLYFLSGVFSLVFLLYLYALRNDQALSCLPPDARVFTPRRIDADSILKTAAQVQQSDYSIQEHLPPKTGGRYIVVGGVR
jgi:hypothetical protein